MKYIYNDHRLPGAVQVSEADHETRFKTYDGDVYSLPSESFSDPHKTRWSEFMLLSLLMYWDSQVVYSVYSKKSKPC